MFLTLLFLWMYLYLLQELLFPGVLPWVQEFIFLHGTGISHVTEAERNMTIIILHS